MRNIVMKSLTDTFKLHNGVEMPCVGLGTWQTTDDVTKNAVLAESRRLQFVWALAATLRLWWAAE